MSAWTQPRAAEFETKSGSVELSGIVFDSYEVVPLSEVKVQF